MGLKGKGRFIAKKILGEKRYRAARKVLYSHDLPELALLYGSDKHGSHFYAQHYQRHFEPLRNRKLNLLEIGIGGYEDPEAGGESLRMWKRFFPKANIYGIDIYDKRAHDEARIKTYQGSQVDEAFLRKVKQEIGDLDLIIDDGSHLNEHVIDTFHILFPLLSPHGIYVVEDVQTSYWAEVGGIEWGGSPDLSAPHTMMNFFKSLVDGLNYEEFPTEGYEPSYYDRHIVSMHFYHNMVFIYKGVNNEGSNVLGKRDT